jgi:hypothetical protein
MTSDPDQLRREIEHTQRNLGADMNALTEKVTPGRIIDRRVGRARGAVTSMKEKIMGSASSGADTAGDKVGSAVSSAGDQVSSMASSASDTVSAAPGAVRRGTEGNPLAAGLIAFGAGWLVASLLPASRAEEQVAGQAKELVQDQAGNLGGIAGELKENLREPAKHAVESIKSTADDAASNVSQEARSAVGDVTEQAKDAKQEVQGQARQ